MERFEKFVTDHAWKASSSPRYKNAPHEYVLRFKIDDPEEFDWAVQFIKENQNHQEYFYRTPFMYFKHGDYKYWAMVAKKGGAIEIINRAKI